MRSWQPAASVRASFLLLSSKYKHKCSFVFSVDSPPHLPFLEQGWCSALCSQVSHPPAGVPGQLNTATVAPLCTQLSAGTRASPDPCRCPGAGQPACPRPSVPELRSRPPSVCSACLFSLGSWEEISLESPRRGPCMILIFFCSLGRVPTRYGYLNVFCFLHSLPLQYPRGTFPSCSCLHPIF